MGTNTLLKAIIVITSLTLGAGCADGGSSAQLNSETPVSDELTAVNAISDISSLVSLTNTHYTAQGLASHGTCTISADLNTVTFTPPDA